MKEIKKDFQTRNTVVAESMSGAIDIGTFFMKVLVPVGILAAVGVKLFDILDPDGQCVFCGGTGENFLKFSDDIELFGPCLFCGGSGFDGLDWGSDQNLNIH